MEVKSSISRLIFKGEGVLRVLCLVLLVTTVCLARFDTETEVIFGSIKRKATVKDLDSLGVLVIVESVAAGYTFLQLSRWLLIIFHFQGGSSSSSSSPTFFNAKLAWFCFFLDQAEKSSHNYIGIFKLAKISGKRRDLVPAKTDENGSDMDSDGSSSDEDEENEENEGPQPPVLQIRKVAHEGGVNRIRAMTQNPHICASWAETGHVQIWDFSSHLNALAKTEAEVSTGASTVVSQAPLLKYGGHKDEGYALDWSPLVPGRLVSGDCKNCIHLWEPSSAGSWNVDNTPYVGHTASVEDLQWSPTESDVFASCSVDGTIAIWDTRIGKSPAGTIKAHKADVNVISWNRLASCMLASGCDDGTFSIRDLRLLQGDSLVAHFEYHKHPITSIEWSPHEPSTLAVASADHQLTIWDLSLERDEEEEAEFRAKIKEQVNAPEDLPPQLLFVHQGQKDLKELHWHNQIPGMVMSTASDGFNVLMPSNVDSTLPSTEG